MAVLTRTVCHYCGTPQPRRHIREIELSAAGTVGVCRDVESCQRRARSLLNPPLAPLSTRSSRESSRPRRRRSLMRWIVVLAICMIGVLVLPHFTIDGRHWHFWLIP